MKWLLGVIPLALLMLAACTGASQAERQQMIAFTREDIKIETQRDQLLDPLYAPPVLARVFKRSAPQLRNQLVLLKAPQTLQHVKDALVEAYNLEIEAAGRQDDRDSGAQFLYRADRFNVNAYVESYKNYIWFDRNSPWITAQKLRREAYANWLRSLQGHGIDPAKEGFTYLR